MGTLECIDCGKVVKRTSRHQFRCVRCRKIHRRRQQRSYGRTVRALRPGETIPDGEPKRYRDPRGYMRLRWKIGPKLYIEAYEHRLLAGNPPNNHVHHANEDKTDNSKSNLVVIDPREHRRLHTATIDVERAATLYTSGLSTKQVSKILGNDPAAIWRALKRHGVELRSEQRIAIPKRELRN